MISKNKYKLLYLLSENSRIQTKELSKNLKISQQACSASISGMQKKDIKSFDLIVDPSKLGCVNLIVGFDYLKFNKKDEALILQAMKECPSIIKVEICKRGVDLLVEYSCNNLSHFNKLHLEVVKNLNSYIKTKFVMPVIVKYHFSRNYLSRIKRNSFILCGDRSPETIDAESLLFINNLSLNSRVSLLSISKKTSLGIKKLISLKKSLEKKEIIKGYSCTPNLKKWNISRRIFLLRFSDEIISEIYSVIEFSKVNPHIIEVCKLIGYYQVMIICEFLEPDFNILSQLRSQFNIYDYLSIDSNDISFVRNYFP